MVTIGELRAGVLAATAISLGVGVVTQDDYVDIPGLAVVKV